MLAAFGVNALIVRVFAQTRRRQRRAILSAAAAARCRRNGMLLRLGGDAHRKLEGSRPEDDRLWNLLQPKQYGGNDLVAEASAD